jgi:hypothetical protein
LGGQLLFDGMDKGTIAGLSFEHLIFIFIALTVAVFIVMAAGGLFGRFLV